MRRLIQFKYLYYKDYQAVRRRQQQRRADDRQVAGALYAGADQRQLGVRDRRGVRQHLAVRRLITTRHCRVRPAKASRTSRTPGDYDGHQIFRPHGGFGARCVFDRRRLQVDRPVAVTLRHATPDQNTTFTIGVGYSSDEVFPQRWPGFHAHEEHARWHRRHHAGAEPQRYGADQLVLRAPARLSDGSIQSIVRR